MPGVLGQSDLHQPLSEFDRTNLQRVIVRQVEAEPEKRAKVIHAQNELEALQQLPATSLVIGCEPSSLQLRYLQTLTEIAAEKNCIVPAPSGPADKFSTSPSGPTAFRPSCYRHSC